MIREARIRSATPGSYIAQLGGCTCDAKRNYYGVAMDSGKGWAVNETCDMHGTQERWNALPHRVVHVVAYPSAWVGREKP